MFLKDKYGYIDKSGKWVIEPEFTQAGGFTDGVAVVKHGGVLLRPYGATITKKGEFYGQFALIDRSGKSMVEFKKDVTSVKGFSEGLAAVEVKKGSGGRLTGFIDKSGKFILEPKYSFVDSFQDGLAQFLLDGKWTFMNRAGKIVCSTPYQVSYGFKRGLAFMEQVGPGGYSDIQNSKYGYIDKACKVVWNPTK